MRETYKLINFDVENFGQSLILQGVIDAEDLERAKMLSVREGISLDRAILRLSLAEEEKLLPIMAEFSQIAYFPELSNCTKDMDRIDVLSVEYCSSKSVAPVFTQSNQRMILISDPWNSELTEELNFFVGGDCQLGAAPSQRIREFYSNQQISNSSKNLNSSNEVLAKDEEKSRLASVDGPVITFVNRMIDEAVIKRASDIHFESSENGLEIRFRVNGRLTAQSVDRTLNPSAVFARLKVLASLNVSEKRLPQDGRISHSVAGRKIDLRVSSLPTSFGESIVCRLLDPARLQLGWEKLGFANDLQARIIDLIERPNGLFLVTGPTGSGKTTTLYTALSHLNTEDRKILTVEDPIEYDIDGFQQVQVDEHSGLTFAKALRSFLRHDPNIIMVGEIRDEETAEIACRLAMVGRMVFSTLHTRTPEGAISRLVDLGVPEFTVNDVLLAALGQSLVPSEMGLNLETRLIEF